MCLELFLELVEEGFGVPLRTFLEVLSVVVADEAVPEGLTLRSLNLAADAVHELLHHGEVVVDVGRQRLSGYEARCVDAADGFLP